MMSLQLPSGAADVAIVVATKGQSFSQTTPNSPVLAPGTPFAFSAFVDLTTPGAVNTVSLRLPNGTTLQLAKDENGMSFHLDYPAVSQSALDAVYPNGTYTFTINAAHDGLKTVTVILSGDSYPSTPRISNYTAAQSINPAMDFAFSWDAMAGATVSDFMQLRLEDDQGDVFRTGDEPGAPGALNGLSTSVVSQRHTLSTSTLYSGRLFFAKLVNVNTTSYPGVTAIAAYSKETEFDIHSGSSSGADVRLYGVAKGHNLAQSGDSPPVLKSAGAHSFLAWVDFTAPGAVTSAVLRVPNGSVKSMLSDPDALNFREQFDSQAALDSGYPSGAYALTVNAAHDGTKNLTLPLSGDVYPSAPRVSNYPAAQAIDPNRDFTLAWDPIIGGTTNDFVQLEIGDRGGGGVFQTPNPWAMGALTFMNTSVTIPAGKLSAGVSYIARLIFAKTVSINTASYPGVIGFAAYFAATEFDLLTSGIGSGDSVGDGIPDAWRAAYFGGEGKTTNMSSCAACDFDMDGMSNLEEFLAGTNPTNNRSKLRITGIDRVGADIQVTWTVATNRTYVLQVSTNLLSDSFAIAANQLAVIEVPAAPPMVLTNFVHSGGATNRGTRFYRVVCLAGGGFSLRTPYLDEAGMAPIREAYSASANTPWGFAHDGIDFFPNSELDLKPFQAAAPGVVDGVDLWQNGSNWQVNVSIRYDQTYTCEYVFEPMSSVQSEGQFQRSHIIVSPGQHVSAGDIIGYLHAPADGSHVHFGVYQNHRAVCPSAYFTEAARQSILRLLRLAWPGADLCY